MIGGGTRWIGASKERLESGARTTKKECKQQQKKEKRIIIKVQSVKYIVDSRTRS